MTIFLKWCSQVGAFEREATAAAVAAGGTMI
jgi:hypothetical protein